MLFVLGVVLMVCLAVFLVWLGVWAIRAEGERDKRIDKLLELHKKELDDK